jgi:hypothetical protein
MGRSSTRGASATFMIPEMDKYVQHRPLPQIRSLRPTQYRGYLEINLDPVLVQLYPGAYWTGTNLTGYMQSSAITFTTRKSAQGIDLVTATKDQNYSEDQGIAFKIMDTEKASGSGERCAAVANYTVTPNPCRVKIDSAAASNTSASSPEQLCSCRNPPIDCPSDESAAQQLLVEGMACLMAVFGALSYLLT